MLLFTGAMSGCKPCNRESPHSVERCPATGRCAEWVELCPAIVKEKCKELMTVTSGLA